LLNFTTPLLNYLNRIYQRVTPRWFGYASAIILTLGLVALVGIAYLFTSSVRPQLELNIKIQKKHEKLYLEDLDVVSRFDLFKNIKSGIRDAGPTLNPRLHWTPRIPGSPTGANPLVPVVSRERLLRYRNDWIRQHSKADSIKADLSIFQDLADFDYWDLETTSPLALVIAKKLFVPPPSLPQPDTADILALAKLRLMYGAEKQEPLQALKDVRNFTRLLFSTESEQLFLAGLSMLDIERRAYRYYVDEQGFAADQWTPIDRNISRRAQRATQGTRGYLRLWTPDDIFKKIFSGTRLPIGFCAAANEAFPAEFAIRPLLEPHWPFEHDFTASYRRLDKTLEKALANCRLRYLRYLVTAGNFKADLPGPELFLALPYARHLFGMKISSVNFDGFESYNALDANKPDQTASGSL
jgi:hypothetical protein